MVDLEPLFRALEQVRPWVAPREGCNGRMLPEETARIEEPAGCVLCGCCDAAIDLGDKTLPSALVKVFRLARDPRDRLGAERLDRAGVTAEALGLFLRELPRRCPKGIDLSRERGGGSP